jgi:hypothetical protein
MEPVMGAAFAVDPIKHIGHIALHLPLFTARFRAVFDMLGLNINPDVFTGVGQTAHNTQSASVISVRYCGFNLISVPDHYPHAGYLPFNVLCVPEIPQAGQYKRTMFVPSFPGNGKFTRHCTLD